MSEKRFEVDVDHLLRVWDTEKNKRLEIEDIVDKLNEQQVKIQSLEDENAKYHFNLSLAETKVKNREKQIGEQQATIEAKDKEIERLKSLLEFSEHMIDANLVVELKYSYGKWNANVRVIDDE